VGALEGWGVRAGARAYFGPRSGLATGVGDVMVDGVLFPQMVLRPLSLSGPFLGSGRQQAAGSWPRFIG
jgi:hypothetical protein